MKKIVICLSLLILICMCLSSCISTGILYYSDVKSTEARLNMPVSSNGYVMSIDELSDEIIKNYDLRKQSDLRNGALSNERISFYEIKEIEMLGTAFIVLKDGLPANEIINSPKVFFEGTGENHNGFPINRFFIIYKLTYSEESSAKYKTCYISCYTEDLLKENLDKLDYGLNDSNDIYALEDLMWFFTDLYPEFYDVYTNVPGFERTYKPREEIKFLLKDDVGTVNSISEITPALQGLLKNYYVQNFKYNYGKEDGYTDLSIDLEKEYLLTPRSDSKEEDQDTVNFNVYYMMVFKIHYADTGYTGDKVEYDKYMVSKSYQIAKTAERTILFELPSVSTKIYDTFEDVYADEILANNDDTIVLNER